MHTVVVNIVSDDLYAYTDMWQLEREQKVYLKS